MGVFHFSYMYICIYTWSQGHALRGRLRKPDAPDGESCRGSLSGFARWGDRATLTIMARPIRGWSISPPFSSRYGHNAPAHDM